MKRIMWFFALIPVAVTSIVLQFMPDIIPMHHDLAGNTDRWGSKMESFIFPVISIVGLSQAVMFGIMHYFILYSSYVQASTGGSKSSIDIAKVSCILCGIMFVVLGNFMTKAKKNSVVGVRTVWSMHNDNTWRKSNLIGAICIICAGLLTIITTVFANGIISTILMLVYIILASVIAVIYSKKEFDIERKKEGLS